ncbi:MAG: hypothetical protein NVS4B6_11950 [Mycobacterium sp.]
MTVNVGAPAPNQTAIQTAVQSLVTAYNSALDLINGKRPGQYGVGQGASSVTLPQ